MTQPRGGRPPASVLAMSDETAERTTWWSWAPGRSVRTPPGGRDEGACRPSSWSPGWSGVSAASMRASPPRPCCGRSTWPPRPAGSGACGPARSTSARCWRGATTGPATGTTPARRPGWTRKASTWSAATAGWPASAGSRSRWPGRASPSCCWPGRPSSSPPAPRPAVPPIEGLREAKPWTNIEATSSQTVPDRLIVLGGGVVACEMAQAYAGLGAQVTVIERAERLLGRTEPFAGDLVAAGLREAGVDVRLGTTVTRVERAGGDRHGRGHRDDCRRDDRRRGPGAGRARPGAGDRRRGTGHCGAADDRLPEGRRVDAGRGRRATDGSTPSATSTAGTC